MVDIPSFTFTPIPQQAYEDLLEKVREFEMQLPPDMELGITAGSAASAIHVNSTDLNGQMFVVNGVDEMDNPARLIQHYSQINILLVALPKRDKDKKRIGF